MKKLIAKSVEAEILASLAQAEAEEARAEKRRREAIHPSTESRPRSEALERLIGKRRFKYRSRY